MIENDKKLTFNIFYPTLIPAFMPAVAITPLMIILGRELDGIAQGITVIVLSLFIVGMISAGLAIGLRSRQVIVEHAGIQIGKRQYEWSNIKKISYDRKQKFFTFHLKEGVHPRAHLKDRNHEEEILAQLKLWLDQKGVEFSL